MLAVGSDGAVGLASGLQAHPPSWAQEKEAPPDEAEALPTPGGARQLPPSAPKGPALRAMTFPFSEISGGPDFVLISLKESPPIK